MKSYWILVDRQHKRAYLLKTLHWLKSFGDDMSSYKISPSKETFMAHAISDYKLYVYTFLTQEELLSFGGHILTMFPKVETGFFVGFHQILEVKRVLDTEQFKTFKFNFQTFVNWALKFKILKVKLPWKEMEKNLLENSLIIHSGNVARTAKSLGLHRQSLQRKLKKLNIK